MKRLKFLLTIQIASPEKDYKDPIVNDTINSIKAVKLIQEYNGERAATGTSSASATVP